MLCLNSLLAVLWELKAPELPLLEVVPADLHR